MAKCTIERTEKTEEMRDAKEFAEIYSKLKPEDRYQVKGILIGLQMRDQILEPKKGAVATA